MGVRYSPETVSANYTGEVSKANCAVVTYTAIFGSEKAAEESTAPVAVRGDLDAGVVQPQDAHIAVLGGHLHLRVQPLEDGLQVIGIAGLGDGLGVGLGGIIP